MRDHEKCFFLLNLAVIFSKFIPINIHLSEYMIRIYVHLMIFYLNIHLSWFFFLCNLIEGTNVDKKKTQDGVVEILFKENSFFLN